MEERVGHLRFVSKKFSGASLRFNLNKCVFDQVEFLGHLIDK